MQKIFPIAVKIFVFLTIYLIYSFFGRDIMNLTVDSVYTSFSQTSVISSKADGAFAAALSAEIKVYSVTAVEGTYGKVDEETVKNMYVRSKAHDYVTFVKDPFLMSDEEQTKEFFEAAELEARAINDIRGIHDWSIIYIGFQELPAFLEKIQAGAANGIPLADVIQQQREDTVPREDMYTSRDGNAAHDLFYIDLAEGNVVDVTCMQDDGCETYAGYNFNLALMLSMADDITTFIRYTYFRQDSDDPAAVEAVLADIKANAPNYNSDRYLRSTLDGIKPMLPAEVIEAKAKYFKEHYHEFVERETKQFDELMEMIDRHFGITKYGLEWRAKGLEMKRLEEQSEEQRESFLPALNITDASEELEMLA